MQDAFGKDRTLFGFSGFEVVVLDGGDKPNVGIIEEGLEVWPSLGLARLASIGSTVSEMVVRLIGPKLRTKLA